MATDVHPTAVIAPGAELGVDVRIGPYAVVGSGVRIGDRTRIGPQVVIDGVTTIGEDNEIVGQASLGGPPQDKSYRGEATRLEIGDRNMIREFVTINRGTVKGGGITMVGSGTLLMACCHVAHDCIVEDNVILANNVMLAGHVHVGEYANVSGAVGTHHFVRIGAFSYVGGMTRLEHDAPPFMIVEGSPGRARGVNVIGLQRAGMAEEDVEGLRVAFRRIYRSGVPRRRVLDEMKADDTTPKHVRLLIQALEETESGTKGRYRQSLRAEFARQGAERILGEVHEE